MTRAQEPPGDTTFVLSPETIGEERGEGPCVLDPDGSPFPDFMAGFWSAITGYCQPKIVAASRDQAGKLLQIIGTANPIHAALAKRVVELAPGPLPRKVQFGNSGAEAVEIAIKMARFKSRKREVIAFHGAFHGRTYGALHLMSKRYAREGLYPMSPGAVHVPYAYCYRCPFRKTYPLCELECAPARPRRWPVPPLRTGRRRRDNVRRVARGWASATACAAAGSQPRRHPRAGTSTPSARGEATCGPINGLPASQRLFRDLR